MRTIFETSTENAEIVNWLAERGRLETAVSREVFPKENLGDRLRNFLSRSANVVQRMNSLSVRQLPAMNLEFRCRENAAGLRDFRPTKLKSSKERWSKDQSREREPKTNAGQLPIIGSVGSVAVSSIPAGAARCVSALRR
jgi:hypothetical protein